MSAAADTSQVIASKHLANLKAQMALRGFEVHDTVTGGWLVARWNLSRYCQTIEDLEAFAESVGAA